jgi:hypothetical protein
MSIIIVKKQDFVCAFISINYGVIAPIKGRSGIILYYEKSEIKMIVDCIIWLLFGQQAL